MCKVQHYRSCRVRPRWQWTASCKTIAEYLGMSLINLSLASFSKIDRLQTRLARIQRHWCVVLDPARRSGKRVAVCRPAQCNCSRFSSDDRRGVAAAARRPIDETRRFEDGLGEIAIPTRVLRRSRAVYERGTVMLVLLFVRILGFGRHHLNSGLCPCSLSRVNVVVVDDAMEVGRLCRRGRV